MRLDRPFLKLPVQFDADVLAAEVRALPATAWVPHPTGFKGNEAVRLITPGGRETDGLIGEMAPTEHLLSSPYMMQIMGDMDLVWGRSRLMGLGAGREVPRHVDSHYYWRTHWRIHIPVITNPDVTFTCGGETVHMDPGECWLFDSFRWHRVHNGGAQARIHLVIDTVGGHRLRELMEGARRGAAIEHVGPGGPLKSLSFERMNAPDIMSPWELRVHLRFLRDEATPHPLLEDVLKRLDDFADDWAASWAQFGTDIEGVPNYVALLDAVKSDLDALGGSSVLLKNRMPFYVALGDIVFLNLIGPDVLSKLPSETAAVA
jgi:mannose-6-phosphate isomerase-like protein (cupin superfamily)